MTRAQRWTYAAVTFTMFLVGDLLYGSIVLLSPATIPFHRLLGTTFAGLMGGYLLASILSGILLFTTFMRRLSLVWKIIATALFPITCIVIVYGGFFSCLPYGIYNFVRLMEAPAPQPLYYSGMTTDMANPYGMRYP